MTLRLQRTRSRGRRLRAALDVCLPPWAVLVLAGCGGGGTGYRSQEADELRFQNTRREEELKKAEEVVRLLKAQAAALAAERDALLGQVVDLKTQVRAQRQGMDQLEADRGATEERLRQATERNEDLRKTLERATSLLGLVGDEVASLRAELRGMEASTRRPRGQSEDLDFVEKSALLSAKIEQLHFEILRERALLGAFSRPRASPPAQSSAGEPASEPGAAPSSPPAGPTTTTPLPRPRTEPKEDLPAGAPPRDGAPPEPGVWAKAGGAIRAAWQWLPLERIGKWLQTALLVGGAALALGVIAILGRRLSRRLRGAASGLLSSLWRRRAPELDIEEDPRAEESPGTREEEDLEGTAHIEPVGPASAGAGEPEAESPEGPARETGGAAEGQETEAPEASVTPVIAESADFFQAFQRPEKEIPRELPEKPRPHPATGRAPAAKAPGPRPAPPRPAVESPTEPSFDEEATVEIEAAVGPEATQAIERTDAVPGPGDGTFTQVIPEVDRTEWDLTQELSEHGPDDFKHTQVISHEAREDFLSTQVIPAIPEVEGPPPRELFPPAREADTETAPTQVIKEPEGLKGPDWPGQDRGRPGQDRGRPGQDRGRPGQDRGRPGQKGKGAGAQPRPRAEKRVPPRKQPPSDKDLLAELEDLIGRKIDEPTL